MSPTITAIDQLDYDISLAYIALGVARSAWIHCPSAENTRRVNEAEQHLGSLLAARRRARRWAGSTRPAVVLRLPGGLPSLPAWPRTARGSPSSPAPSRGSGGRPP